MTLKSHNIKVVNKQLTDDMVQVGNEQQMYDLRYHFNLREKLLEKLLKKTDSYNQIGNE